jgi:hypothetical protein
MITIRQLLALFISMAPVAASAAAMAAVPVTPGISRQTLQVQQQQDALRLELQQSMGRSQAQPLTGSQQLQLNALQFQQHLQQQQLMQRQQIEQDLHLRQSQGLHPPDAPGAATLGDQVWFSQQREQQLQQFQTQQREQLQSFDNAPAATSRTLR